MIVPVQVPPGVYANGTEYQSKGRWNDAALVRWRAGAMGPIGGWRQWSTTGITGIARGMLSWRDNAGNRWIAIGTAAKLYVYNDAGTRYDITPGGLTVGEVDATYQEGYGGWLYGEGPYGVARPDLGTITPATAWTLDTWGEYLIACSSADGKIYQWTLDTGTPAVALTNAPTGNRSVVVTDERFVLALGAGGDPRIAQWCNQEDNTVWNPLATNQAGSYSIHTRGELVCARRIRGQVLVLTTTDAHTGTYIGPPYVYSFDKVGEGCGITAAQAVAVVDNQAVWLGERGFFLFNGYVRRLECEVQDYFFRTLSPGQLSKTVAFHNSQFDEVWFIYPSDVENECDSYVSWNYVENTWAIGTSVFPRSAAADRIVFSRPMMVGTDGYIYEHEVGTVYGGEVAYAETGPLELAAGERVISVNYLWPDENTLGDVSATFYGKMYPTDDELSYGPYTMNEPTSVRLTARQVRLRVDAVANSEWRWGVPRADVIAGGKR